MELWYPICMVLLTWAAPTSFTNRMFSTYDCDRSFWPPTFEWFPVAAAGRFSCSRVAVARRVDIWCCSGCPRRPSSSWRSFWDAQSEGGHEAHVKVASPRPRSEWNFPESLFNEDQLHFLGPIDFGVLSTPSRPYSPLQTAVVYKTA